MTPERWQCVDEIFQSAIELQPEARSAFVVGACANDEELRREVESLIVADAQGLSLVEEPAFETAVGLLAMGEPAPHELLEGQSISHYEIVGLIGRGGMGEVYLAKDKLLNRRVALKLLPAAYTSNQDRLRRFQQEAQAASSLNHPNILTIYELGQVDGQQFIATEFVEGQTLRQRLKRAPINVAEAIEFACQIGSALSTAHEAGIVHRDIKPENLMLRRDGYLKVLDFGLAKLTEQHEPTNDAQAGAPKSGDTNLSSGLVMGTVKYMSPEQAQGLPVDPRSDIFSFGVVLYELLAGRTPFEGARSSELVAAILEQEPPLLTDVPDKLQHLINKALRKKKEERYQTIQAMLADLKSLKQDKASGGDAQPVSATTTGSGLLTSAATVVYTRSAVESVVSSIKDHKTTATFILACVALVGLSLTFGLNRLRNKLRAPTQEMTVTVTVPGNSGPWRTSLNPAFAYTLNNAYASPTVVSAASGISFVAGSNLTVTYVSGTITGDDGHTFFDANGSARLTNKDDSTKGRFPGFYLNSGPSDNEGKLIGAFANNGVLVGAPFPIGNGPTLLTIPAGATELLMGINDNYYSDNSGALIMRVTTAQTVTIPSTAGPWNPSLNPAFDYGVHDNTPSIVIDAASGIAFTPESNLVVVYLSGTVQAGVGHPVHDANGQQNYVTNSCIIQCFPGFYMNPGPNVYAMELVGTFANNGVILGKPFPIGNQPTTLTIPTGANQLLLGINDNRYADNNGSFTVAVSSGAPSFLPGR